MLWKGLVYEVYDKQDQSVIKIPRSKIYRKNIEEDSYLLHQKYLKWSVAQSDFIESWDSYNIIQEKINGNPVDLHNITNQKIHKILEQWQDMQKAENILFDIFWLEWMIQLFNYYFDEKALKSLWDLCIPMNAWILNYFYNFPPELLKQMNQNKWNPFIAHNLLEDKDWNITLIDTDFRPLDIKHPLNMVGDWITQKAIDDIIKK
jgi:hypothetical protein